MIIQIADTIIMPLRIPSSLRSKTVNTKVSQEIYFIDCLNDLFYCTKQVGVYHTLRASSILRVLLVDRAICNFAKNYEIPLLFKATENQLKGEILSKEQIEQISNLFEEITGSSNQYRHLKLEQKPYKSYSLDDFCNKACLSIKSDQEYLFSIKNIINLLANKHGPSHLDFNKKVNSLSSDKLSFFMGDFNPFSIASDSKYLEIIRETSMILVRAVYPLAKLIIEELNTYDKSFIQGKVTVNAKVITPEELENMKGK